MERPCVAVGRARFRFVVGLVHAAAVSQLEMGLANICGPAPLGRGLDAQSLENSSQLPIEANGEDNRLDHLLKRQWH